MLYIIPKRRSTFNILHSFTVLKREFFINCAMRNWNSTGYIYTCRWRLKILLHVKTSKSHWTEECKMGVTELSWLESRLNSMHTILCYEVFCLFNYTVPYRRSDHNHRCEELKPYIPSSRNGSGPWGLHVVYMHKTILRGLSQLTNYTDRATAACPRS
jgi:hypothetical protein